MDPELRKFLYGSSVYLALSAAALVTILLTEAEISILNVIIGALAGSIYITIRYILDTHAFLQRIYDILAFAILIIYGFQKNPGTLSILAVAIISTVSISYYLYFYRG